MGKRKVATSAEVIEDDQDRQLIDSAIEQGRELITTGSSKIDAAIAIYNQLKHLPQQSVVDAFISGANLTPKGALTYWYNCRRRAV